MGLPGRKRRRHGSGRDFSIWDDVHTNRSNELTGADRRHLRGLANPRKVVVQVGEVGVTQAVTAALDAALLDHELIKVRIAGDRDERREIAARIAVDTHSALAGIVGHVAIFYREAADAAERKIHLPSSGVGVPRL